MTSIKRMTVIDVSITKIQARELIKGELDSVSQSGGSDKLLGRMHSLPNFIATIWGPVKLTLTVTANNTINGCIFPD